MKLLLRKIRVALTPRGSLLKTRLSNGAVVYGRNRAGHGGRGVYVFRDALEPELAHLESFLQPGGVFMDIGGNTGIYTMKAAQFFRNCGSGTVITYEPLPEMLAVLNRNAQLNSFDNIRLRGFCLGETTGTAEFWLNFNRPASSSLVGRDPSARRLSTLVFRLDEIFPLEKLDRLDYVKIDVEGAEAYVIAGAKATFTRFRPIIQMETDIANSALGLDDYTEWQAAGSPNKVCIPAESPHIQTAKALGLKKIL